MIVPKVSLQRSYHVSLSISIPENTADQVYNRVIVGKNSGAFLQTSPLSVSRLQIKFRHWKLSSYLPGGARGKIAEGGRVVPTVIIQTTQKEATWTIRTKHLWYFIVMPMGVRAVLVKGYLQWISIFPQLSHAAVISSNNRRTVNRRRILRSVTKLRSDTSCTYAPGDSPGVAMIIHVSVLQVTIIKRRTQIIQRQQAIAATVSLTPSIFPPEDNCMKNDDALGASCGASCAPLDPLCRTQTTSGTPPDQANTRNTRR